jgi:hypothetical protein
MLLQAACNNIPSALEKSGKLFQRFLKLWNGFVERLFSVL